MDTPNAQPHPDSVGPDGQEIKGLEADKLAAFQERCGHVERAAMDPLPGPLREAFASDPPRIHGYTLHPVTAGLFQNLKRIDSPMLKILELIVANQGKTVPELEKIIADEMESDLEGELGSAYCFIHPAKKIRALLDAGRDKFREAMFDEIGDNHHPVKVAELVKACQMHLMASFNTVLKYQASDGGESFTPPPAGPTTGSAGGSTTSAAPAARPVNP